MHGESREVLVVADIFTIAFTTARNRTLNVEESEEVLAAEKFIARQS